MNVHVITMASIHPMDQAMRDRMRDSLNLMLPYTRASVLVITSPGFVASLVRGVLASAILFKKLDFPFKVLGSTEAAFDHIARCPPP